MPFFKHFLYIIIITLCSNLPLAKAAEKQDMTTAPLLFHHFDPDTRLPDYRMTDIIEDKNGNMWFSMMNGLCRFNGYSIQTYAPGKGEHDVPDNRTAHFFLDKKGTLWIRFKTSQIYVYYRYESNDFVTVDKSQVPAYIKKALSTKQNDTFAYQRHSWKRIDKRLVQYTKGVKDSIIYQGDIATKAKLDAQDVYAIYLSKDKKLWVGTSNNGLYFAFTGNNTPKVFLQTDSKLIRTLCSDGGNGLFIGYDHRGIAHSDNKRSVTTTYHYPGETSPLAGKVRHLMLDSKKRLWIATICGIYVKVNGKEDFKHIMLKKDSTNTYNRTYKLIEDRKKGCVWAATWNGLVTINTKSLNIIGRPDTIAKKIHDITLTEDGTMWIASEDGIYKREDNITTLVLPDRICYAISVADDGTVWCGTSNGVIYKRISETDWHEALKDEAANLCVKGLICKGRYVYVAAGNLLTRTDNQTLRTELLSTNENDFAEGAYFLNPTTKEILFGSEQGILAIDSNVSVPCIAEENDNDIAYITLFIIVLIGCCTGTWLFVKRKNQSKEHPQNPIVPQPTATETPQHDNNATLEYIQTQKKEFLDKAQSLINKHIQDPDFGVNEFANEMAMSRAQLFRKMKAATGQTPMDYIMSQRTDKAEEMLRTTTRSINDIAQVCGFNDASAFRRNFQKIHSVTPSQYRSGESKVSKQKDD